VQVPDYNTFAPVNKHGSDPDFTKMLDPGGTLSFTTQVHQRFLHSNVNVPVKQTLASDKTLDPAQLGSTPGTSRYTAPNTVNASNDGTFESRSRRGRSVLVGRFRTEEKPPTIGVQGTLTETGIVSVVATVTAAPVAFTSASIGPNNEQDYAADIPISTTLTLKSIGGIAPPCVAFGTESGTLHVVAHSEARGDDMRVWVLHPDPGQSHFTTKSTCQITVGNAFSGGGGLSAKFFAALGDIEIPYDPASTTVDKSRSLGPVNDASHAVVTLVAPPPS